MDIHVDDQELTRRRRAGDATQLAVRSREAIRALTDLRLQRLATDLSAALARAAQDDVSGLGEVLDGARRALHQLRAEANADGRTGDVAPIRSAIDRLGALWAVVQA